MLKTFTLWTRRRDLTADAAVGCWLTQAPLFAAAAGERLRRYSCLIALPADYQGRGVEEAPAWDGVAEAWWDTDDPAEAVALERATTLPGGVPFIGTTQVMVTDVRVHVDRGRPQRGITMLFLLHGRRDLGLDKAVDYWRTRHVPLVRDTLGPRLVRYTTNVALPAPLRSWSTVEEPPFHGAAVLSLDHDEAGQANFVAEHTDVLLPDERAFMGTYRALVTREILVTGAVDASLPLPSEAT